VKEQPRLGNALANDLEAAGVDARSLHERCVELILCGSRASNPDRLESDWDLVAIGKGLARRKRGKIDLIPIDTDILDSPRWLESELAWHVKTHGIWLKGRPGKWIKDVRVTPRTLSAKATRIRYRLSRIDEAWQHLSTSAKGRYLNLLRRDLQRYSHLKLGKDIPPSPILDTLWLEAKSRTDPLTGLRKLLGALPERLREDVVTRLNMTGVLQRDTDQDGITSFQEAAALL
jgi:hypothetical protein